MKNLFLLTFLLAFALKLISQTTYYSVVFETIHLYENAVTQIDIKSFGLKVLKTPKEVIFKSVNFQPPPKDTLFTSKLANKNGFERIRNEIKDNELVIIPSGFRSGIKLISRLFSKELPVQIISRSPKNPYQYFETIESKQLYPIKQIEDFSLNLNLDSRRWDYARLNGNMKWNKEKNQLISLDADLIAAFYVGTYNPYRKTYRVKIVEEKNPQIVEFIDCNVSGL